MKTKLGFNWKAIRTELNSQDWEEAEPGREERLLYIGSVFNLLPSGKYYMPWAYSNVDICDQCCNSFDLPCDESSPCHGIKYTDPLKNPDNHCEACRDAAWRNQLEQEAYQNDLFVTNGEGDPCDIFVGECRDKNEEN